MVGIFTIIGFMKMNKIKFFLKKEQIVTDKTIISKAESYLEKARYNLETLGILDKMDDKNIKDKLNISTEYDPSEWIVICGYYAMYSAALGLIAKVGFRSKNHIATMAG